MYLDSLHIFNNGPIENLNIKARFNEDGTPCPIILIGDNGKGKTITTSYITDSLIEISKNAYNNIVEKEGALYRLVAPKNIMSGKAFSTTIISFKNNDDNLIYVEKTR